MSCTDAQVSLTPTKRALNTMYNSVFRPMKYQYFLRVVSVCPWYTVAVAFAVAVAAAPPSRVEPQLFSIPPPYSTLQLKSCPVSPTSSHPPPAHRSRSRFTGAWFILFGFCLVSHLAYLAVSLPCPYPMTWSSTRTLAPRAIGRASAGDTRPTAW